MSRASEYASSMDEAGTRRPDAFVAVNRHPQVWSGTSHDKASWVAWVHPDGHFGCEGTKLTPIDALKLAEWIIDTWGPPR